MARIDTTSALVDPSCTVCNAPVSAHFSKEGRWAGCAPMQANPRQRYVLIPDRRVVFSRPGVSNDYMVRATTNPSKDQSNRRRATSAVALRERQAVILATPTVPPVGARPTSLRAVRLRYVASYGIRDPKARRIGSERDREVLAVIARNRTGISRPDLLRALNAEQHTGIVDGAVRRLRLRKAITTQIVTEG